MKNIRVLAALIACLMLLTVVSVFSVSAAEQESLYVTSINKAVAAASGAVFTSDFNETNTIKSSEGNFLWVTLVTAEPTDKEGVYKIIYTGKNLANGTKEGEPDKSVTVPKDGFVYAAHLDDTEEGSEICKTSSDNQAKTAALKVGDLVTISGIDLKAGTIKTDSVIYIGEANVEQPGDTTSKEEPAESKEESIDDTSEEDTSEEVTSADVSKEESKEGSKTESKEELKDEAKVESDDESKDEEDDGLSTPAIIGIVAGAVILIAVISYAATRKKK